MDFLLGGPRSSGKKLKAVAEFIGNLWSGKRVLYIHPRYVVMDSQTWSDITREKGEQIKMVHFDEFAETDSTNWDELLKILEK